ncbi:pectin methylesterase, family CE8 [Zostera marina]|uniref:pectinesterase n=1 Tax=Zostera marina TaxID=29655 RepID=A0A0K9P3C6_ZOSMR|nr:pectin methylesterase, family CE8 [Zostera marina]
MGSSPPFIPLVFIFLVLYVLQNGGGDVLAGKPHNASGKFDAPYLTSKINASKAIIVDTTGNGHVTSIQKAIEQVPEGNSEWIIIHVRAATYREKITIPENKPFIFMRGNGKGKTHLVWNESSTSNTDSATLTVDADNFVAFGISFKNDAPTGVANNKMDKSVAAVVNSDKAAFYHCAFYSSHNTLFDSKGRHYYESCYIQGSSDFIFGRAQSIFEGCEIFVVGDRRNRMHSSVTAQNRPTEEDESGFVFKRCRIYGAGGIYLGRAKGPFSRVIFSKTYFSMTVLPQGWTDWGYNGTKQQVVYGEYDCYGPGSDRSNRVLYGKEFTKEQADHFTTDVKFINGEEWLPAYI